MTSPVVAHDLSTFFHSKCHFYPDFHRIIPIPYNHMCEVVLVKNFEQQLVIVEEIAKKRLSKAPSDESD